MEIHNWSIRRGVWEIVADDGQRIVTPVVDLSGTGHPSGEDRYLVPALQGITVDGEHRSLVGPTVIYRWRSGTIVFQDQMGDITTTPATHRGGDGCDVIEIPGLAAVTVNTRAETIGSISEPASGQ